MKNRVLLKIFNYIQVLFSAYILYSVYNSKLIPDNIRLYVIIAGVALTIGWIFFINYLVIKEKKVMPIVLITLSFIVYAAGVYGVLTVVNVENTIASITSDKKMKVSSVFVTMDSSITSIDNFEGKKIGLLKNEDDYEGHILPLAELEKQNKEYDVEYVISSLDLMGGLVEGTYDIVALPEDYKERFEVNDEFKKNYDKFIEVLKMEDEVDVPENNAKEIVEGEPFTIALIGTDSAIEKHHHNYDVIILLTFNPKTRDLVITSVYRATGMYSSCIGGMDLVNHNGWKGWGPECLKSTVEDFFEIDINHYIMVDFEGFVELVDSLGGITADVPKSFCEQDSERRFGDYIICIDAGEQTLMGEEALAFARHRKSYSGNGGVVRSHNHVTVISAIADKIMTSDIIFRFNDLLKILADNMETDMNEDQLYGLYDSLLSVVKDVGYDIDKINIHSRTINAYGAMLYSPAMNTAVGMGLIYADTYWGAYNTLQTVLYNKTKHPTYYSFDLGDDPEYTSNDYLDKATKDKLKLNPYDPRIMPDLVGDPESFAHTYVSKYAYFTAHVTYVHSNTVKEGLIISQDIPAGHSVNHRFRLNVVVSLGPDVPAEDPITLPDMTGWTRSEVQTWANLKELNSWNFQKVEDPSGYTENNIYMYADEATEAAGVVYVSKAVTFYIAVVSTVPTTPTITLKGSTDITLEVGDTYTDPGYTAWDDYDWYLTDDVVLSGGTVDTSTAGIYTVYYDVSNSKGTDATQKSRTITVVEPEEDPPAEE